MAESKKFEKQFLNALRDIFVGAKVEGDSGYVNLMRIKSRYFEQGVFPLLQQDINSALRPFPDFREELFDKLYTFFQRYFSESGSIYFRYTALHQNIYEKVYTDDRDVILFWKTHMLYYVKTDRIFTSLKVEVEGVKFFFDASRMTLKKSNEKREVVYAFRKVQPEDGTLVFDVSYSEKGKTTRVDDILKDIKKANGKLDDETLNKAFRVFEKQSEVDYFINKDARAFLTEQFDLWMYQYLFAGQNIWSAERLAQLQALKTIATKIIDFISQFEDELVKIWNKPKFVRNSHYVLTLDKLGTSPVLEKLLAHPNLPQQVQEWRELGMIGEDFKVEMITQKDLTGAPLYPQYEQLPIDTKYFSDLEQNILALFEDLDAALDGWLVHSENYQALNTFQYKYYGRIKTIYIDPPYNTAASEIIYSNKYKHSSWISLLYDRLTLTKKILNTNNGFICCTIDDVEQKTLSQLLEIIFGEVVGTVSIRIKPSGRPIPNGFALSHEYAIFTRTNPSNPIARLEHTEEQQNRYKENDNNGQFFWEMFRKAGSNSNRENRPTMFFPFFLNLESGNLRLPKMSFDPSSQSYLLHEKPQKIEIEIYPKKDDGSDGCWYFGYERSKEIVQELKAEKTSDNSYRVYYRRRPNKGAQPTTLWFESKYSATEHGTALLKNLFGVQEIFSYPKSIHAVRDCLAVAGALVEKEGLFLDFFAGSGTTAHAVMNLNREDYGRRKYILVEMGEHFNAVILPRIKKVAFSDKWKDGKASGGKGMSHFVKYYDLEQYEDVLRNTHYADADLFHNSYDDPYHSYVFLRDLKMLDSVDIDSRENKIHFHPERLYPDIDLAETLSLRRGKWIRRITAEYVEFQDGERMSLTDPDWQTIKPLVWW